MRKTHEQFLKELYEKNEYYRDKEFKVVGDYRGWHERILVEDCYGILNTKASVLLKGCKPTIKSAIDKTAYFKNKVKKVSPSLEIISKYKTGCKYIHVKTKHGIHKVFKRPLMAGVIPTIQTALDKKEYLYSKTLNLFKSNYDYSLVEYKNNSTKVKIICPEHGIFKQTINHHLRGVGCPKCFIKNHRQWSDKGWNKFAKVSKHFDSFKVYIIKCWNDDEEFYKIGRTYLKIEKRFSSKIRMPYNYEVIKIFESTSDFKGVCILERSLQNYNKKYKYIPKNKFNGKNECFREYSIPSSVFTDYDINKFKIEKIWEIKGLE